MHCAMSGWRCSMATAREGSFSTRCGSRYGWRSLAASESRYSWRRAMAAGWRGWHRCSGTATGSRFLGDFNICDYMDFVLAPGEEEGGPGGAVRRPGERGLARVGALGAGGRLADAGDPAGAGARPRLRGADRAGGGLPSARPAGDLGRVSGASGQKNRHELRRKLRRLAVASSVRRYCTCCGRRRRWRPAWTTSCA